MSPHRRIMYVKNRKNYHFIDYEMFNGCSIVTKFHKILCELSFLIYKVRMYGLKINE